MTGLVRVIRVTFEAHEVQSNGRHQRGPVLR
jgi:hypothetical protein